MLIFCRIWSWQPSICYENRVSCTAIPWRTSCTRRWQLLLSKLHIQLPGEFGTYKQPGWEGQARDYTVFGGCIRCCDVVSFATFLWMTTALIFSSLCRMLQSLQSMKAKMIAHGFQELVIDDPIEVSLQYSTEWCIHIRALSSMYIALSHYLDICIFRFSMEYCCRLVQDLPHWQ